MFCQSKNQFLSKLNVSSLAYCTMWFLNKERAVGFLYKALFESLFFAKRVPYMENFSYILAKIEECIYMSKLSRILNPDNASSTVKYHCKALFWSSYV